MSILPPLRYQPLGFLLIALTLASPSLSGDAVQLRSGPMVGYVEMREAAVWVQTAEPATVELEYWPTADPAKRQRSSPVSTEPGRALTGTLLATGLRPGTAYEYRLRVNGTPVNLPHPTGFRTPPFYETRTPPPDFKVAIGSGHYVNEAEFDPLNRIPGGDYQIFQAILNQHPQVMFWLGNNVHLREPDWGSQSGVFARYATNRGIPETRELLATVSNLATWSEHDFGPPGAGRLSGAGGFAREGFECFWANPPLLVQDLRGITATFRWSDVEFFLLDDRTERDLSHQLPSRHTILGEAQIDWLVNALQQSTATFKVVMMGSAILNPVNAPGNYRQAEREQEQLLTRLRDHRIPGLFFVSGGKPFGELTKRVRANAPDVFELTVGPLTARAASESRELNYFRVPGTSVFQRHFAILEFHGPENDRQLKVATFDSQGRELWSQQFPAREMGFQGTSTNNR